MPELKRHHEALAGIPPDEIVTVVSGLPRSGTSLMMQILEAAGIPPFTDNERQSDESNQRGYYEHAKVAKLLRNADKSWISVAKGRAIKIVAPLLVSLPRRLKTSEAAMETLHDRILFMKRDIEEISAARMRCCYVLANLLRVGKRLAILARLIGNKKATPRLGAHALVSTQ